MAKNRGETLHIGNYPVRKYNFNLSPYENLRAVIRSDHIAHPKQIFLKVIDKANGNDAGTFIKNIQKPFIKSGGKADYTMPRANLELGHVLWCMKHDKKENTTIETDRTYFQRRALWCLDKKEKYFNKIWDDVSRSVDEMELDFFGYDVTEGKILRKLINNKRAIKKYLISRVNKSEFNNVAFEENEDGDFEIAYSYNVKKHTVSEQLKLSADKLVSYQHIPARYEKHYGLDIKVALEQRIWIFDYLPEYKYKIYWIEEHLKTGEDFTTPATYTLTIEAYSYNDINWEQIIKDAPNEYFIMALSAAQRLDAYEHTSNWDAIKAAIAPVLALAASIFTGNPGPMIAYIATQAAAAMGGRDLAFAVAIVSAVVSFNVAGGFSSLGANASTLNLAMQTMSIGLQAYNNQQLNKLEAAAARNDKLTQEIKEIQQQDAESFYAKNEFVYTHAYSQSDALFSYEPYYYNLT